MNEQLIKEIYNTLIPIITNGITEELEEISTAYYNYILNLYSDNNGSNYEKLKEICINIEMKNWSNKSVILRKKLLLTDNYYDKLIYLSNIGLKNANIRLLNEINNDNKPIEITETQAKENIKLMKEYVNMVKDYNKQEALMILSEGLIDYDYALGLTDNRSFRLGK